MDLTDDILGEGSEGPFQPEVTSRTCVSMDMSDTPLSRGRDQTGFLPMEDNDQTGFLDEGDAPNDYSMNYSNVLKNGAHPLWGAAAEVTAYPGSATRGVSQEVGMQPGAWGPESEAGGTPQMSLGGNTSEMSLGAGGGSEMSLGAGDTPQMSLVKSGAGSDYILDQPSPAPAPLSDMRAPSNAGSDCLDESPAPLSDMRAPSVGSPSQMNKWGFRPGVEDTMDLRLEDKGKSTWNLFSRWQLGISCANRSVC